MLIYFLGLRGAVAFALVLHLQLDDEKRHVLITSTLIIIMFTILCLGGSTLPLLKVCRVLEAGRVISFFVARSGSVGRSVFLPGGVLPGKVDRSV